MSTSLEIETAEYQCVISPSAIRESTEPKPATTTVHAEFGAVSHTGKVRTRNEDHFLVSRINRRQDILLTNVPEDHLPEQTGDEGYLYIVADGMGGMAAGEVASRLAISTSLKLIQGSAKWGFKINQKEARELFDRVSNYIKEIDRTLTNRSESDYRLLGMGTTLTAAYSVGIDLFIIHVGDSRAYLYRAGTLQQLTKDHTLAQAMADAGYIAPEDVRRHIRRNALTNFLGGQRGKVKADVRWLRVATGDRVMLCSDGLTEMVDDASIARILREHDAPPDAAQTLVDEALNRGGRDNVTVIVARYEVPTRESSAPQRTADHKSHLDTTSFYGGGGTALDRGGG
jgi:protein phosphatase